MSAGPMDGAPDRCEFVVRPDGTVFEDKSGAPRLALHATELGFAHPATGAHLHWSMPLPGDVQKFVEELRGKPS